MNIFYVYVTLHSYLPKMKLLILNNNLHFNVIVTVLKRKLKCLQCFYYFHFTHYKTCINYPTFLVLLRQKFLKHNNDNLHFNVMYYCTLNASVEC